MILSKAAKYFAVLLAVASLHAEDVDLEKAVRSLADAEKAYAKLGAEQGFRAASLSVFADDAVIFAPKMVNGKKYWSEATEDPVISWRPSFAAISRSGELGYTTGPWEFRKTKADANPAGFGHFNTIWRKNSEGAWKVVVDLGVDHPQSKESENDVATSVPKSPLPHPETAQAGLEKMRQLFSDFLKTGEGSAVLAVAADDIRVYRRGMIPAVGKAAAQQAVGSEGGKTSRIRSGGGMSNANDLAYEYGEYTSERGGAPEQGIYFCIWRTDAEGNWKLALDLQKK